MHMTKEASVPHRAAGLEVRRIRSDCSIIPVGERHNNEQVGNDPLRLQG